MIIKLLYFTKYKVKNLPRFCATDRLWSYPHVGNRGGGVEELADDVGGGGDAEDDGAEDLLPPGQQQHGVLPPAIVARHHVSLYQAHRAVAFLPETLAVGEVVAIVCTGGRNHSVYFTSSLPACVVH